MLNVTFKSPLHLMVIPILILLIIMNIVDWLLHHKLDVFQIYYSIAIFVGYIIFAKTYRIAIRKDGIYTYLDIFGHELSIGNKLYFTKVAIILSEQNVLFKEMGDQPKDKTPKTLLVNKIKMQFFRSFKDMKGKMASSSTNGSYYAKNKPLLIFESDFRKFLQSVFDRIESGEIDQESKQIASRLGVYLRSNIKTV
jgi:hypothetical protein